jgi:hypothetical protein
MDELKSMTLASGEALGIPQTAGWSKEHPHIDPGSSGEGLPDLEDANVQKFLDCYTAEMTQEDIEQLKALI